MHSLKKILIVDVAGIGDLIMSIPAIRALRKVYPESYIAALVSPRSYDVLKGCPYIDEQYYFDILRLRSFKSLFTSNKIFSSLKGIYKLRSKGFDVAVNLQQIATKSGNFRMRCLFKTINPNLSFGRESEGKGTFYHYKVQGMYFDKVHEVDKKIEIVSLLNVETTDTKLELWIQPNDEKEIHHILQQRGVSSSDYLVGINPASFQPAKLWSAERFAEVADQIIRKYKMKVIFLASAQEAKQVKVIIKKMKNPAINLAGQLSLSQYIALTKNMNIFITLDSAPMHIASVFKIPTVALFGPGQPLKYGPYHNENAIVIQKEICCRPCNKKECEKNECMQAIKIDDVLKAFEKLIRIQKGQVFHEK